MRCTSAPSPTASPVARPQGHLDAHSPTAAQTQSENVRYRWHLEEPMAAGVVIGPRQPEGGDGSRGRAIPASRTSLDPLKNPSEKLGISQILDLLRPRRHPPRQRHRHRHGRRIQDPLSSGTPGEGVGRAQKQAEGAHSRMRPPPTHVQRLTHGRAPEA